MLAEEGGRIHLQIMLLSRTHILQTEAHSKLARFGHLRNNTKSRRTIRAPGNCEIFLSSQVFLDNCEIME